MLKKLIRVANKLDKIGKYAEADFITDIITKFSQSGNFPPDDENDDDFSDEDLGEGEGDEEITYPSLEDEETKKMRAQLPDMLKKQQEMIEMGTYFDDENESEDIVDEFAAFVMSIKDGNYQTMEEVKEAASMLLDMHKDYLRTRSEMPEQKQFNQNR